MLIPPETLFLFACTQHNVSLKGEPMLVHPNSEATAVWVFDTSEMSCPKDMGSPVGTSCNHTWEVRA